MHRPLLTPHPPTHKHTHPQEITLALISVKVNSFCKYRQRTYKRYIETRSCNHCSSGKTMSVLSDRLQPYVCSIQCACAMLSSVACIVLNIFSHYLIKAARFSKKRVSDHKMRDLIFSRNFSWNISHAKKNSARYDRHFMLVFMWSIRFSCQILIKL